MKWLKKITLIDIMLILAIISILLAIILSSSNPIKEVIIQQEGNCLVKRKYDGKRDVYITVCNGVITNVSNSK